MKNPAKHFPFQTLLFLCLMVNCSGAWACDSYEDCMEQQRDISIEAMQYRALTAIAYKLDEISKELKKRD